MQLPQFLQFLRQLLAQFLQLHCQLLNVKLGILTLQLHASKLLQLLTLLCAGLEEFPLGGLQQLLQIIIFRLLAYILLHQLHLLLAHLL